MCPHARKRRIVRTWSYLRMSSLLAALVLATLYHRMWYAVPLIVAISLVYAATRHERPRPILEHAVRFGSWVVGFMLVVFVALYVITWFV